MSVFEMPTEEQVEQGTFQPVEEGIYLVVLNEVERDPVSKKGDIREGLNLHFQVITGTVEGQENREHRELFRWSTSPSTDNGGFFARRLAWIGSALDVIDPNEVGGKQVNPDDFFPSLAWEDAIGKVCYVKIKKSRDEKYREIDGLEIYHVNSPKAAAFPRIQEVIDQVGMRAWGGSKAAKPAASGTASPTKAAAAPKPGAPRPGAKRPAANGNAANGGDRSTAAAAAAEGRPATKADPYAGLDDD